MTVFEPITSHLVETTLSQNNVVSNAIKRDHWIAIKKKHMPLKIALNKTEFKSPSTKSSLTLREVRSSQETKIKMWKRPSNYVSVFYQAGKYTFFMLINVINRLADELRRL